MHLKATIGTLQMEDEAFVLCYYLSWVFYPIFTLIGILQMILFLLYNQKYHPFSDLLIRPVTDAGKLSKVLYMSSSFWLLGVESHDFSQAEHERTGCKAEQIHKLTTTFTQNGPTLSF